MVPPGSVCLSRPTCEFPEIKPSSHEGVCVSLDILPKDPFYLAPIDGQIEEIFSALAHIQESSGPVGASLDAAGRHSDIHGHSSPVRKAASQASPTQLQGSLGPQEPVPNSKDSGVAARSASAELVVMTYERHDRPISGPLQGGDDDVHRRLLYYRDGEFT